VFDNNVDVMREFTRIDGLDSVTGVADQGFAAVDADKVSVQDEPAYGVQLDPSEMVPNIDNGVVMDNVPQGHANVLGVTNKAFEGLARDIGTATLLTGSSEPGVPCAMGDHSSAVGVTVVANAYAAPVGPLLSNVPTATTDYAIGDYAVPFVGSTERDVTVRTSAELAKEGITPEGLPERPSGATKRLLEGLSVATKSRQKGPSGATPQTTPRRDEVTERDVTVQTSAELAKEGITPEGLPERPSGATRGLLEGISVAKEEPMARARGVTHQTKKEGIGT
jgi:hypothetical protein